MLGIINIFPEPGALIGFGRSRVVKEATARNLPEGFQDGRISSGMDF